MRFAASIRPLRSSTDEEDGPYLGRLEGVSFDPVFIMGPHRSGTTILYEVMAKTGAFNVTTVYHVLNRNRLMHLHSNGREEQVRAELAETFLRKGATDRRFDLVKVTPEAPEEYGYALDYQGRRPTLSPKNLPGFLRFCKKVQAVQNPERLLLLKNPFDAPNFVYIKDAIPRSRFVFIHRHPAEVISSQIKAVRSLLEVDNEYVAMVVKRYRRLVSRPRRRAFIRFILSERFAFLFHQVAGNVARVNRFFMDNIHHLGGCEISVTYDELCHDPGATVSRIMGFLGRDDARVRDYAKLISSRRKGLLPEVNRRLDAIQKDNESYCRRFGLTAG